MDMKKSSRIELIDEDEEEFEPLFDYKRIQPFSFVDVEEDSLDRPRVGCLKKQKTDATAAVKEDDKKADDRVLINSDEEDDWLSPAPVVTNDTTVIGDDDTVRRQLRLKREELLSSVRSAEEYIRHVEEETKRSFADVDLSDDESDTSSPRKAALEQTSKPSEDRPKIVISLQDKNGPMPVRVYTDDAFEKIFKMYAEKFNLDLQNLSFSFDGDKVSPNATPSSLGMEEDDIIEVNVKTK